MPTRWAVALAAVILVAAGGRPGSAATGLNVWTTNGPAGPSRYVLFLAVTLPHALADGIVDVLDVLAAATSFDVVP
jgi:hypothetical protein